MAILISKPCHSFYLRTMSDKKNYSAFTLKPLHSITPCLVLPWIEEFPSMGWRVPLNFSEVTQVSQSGRLGPLVWCLCWVERERPCSHSNRDRSWAFHMPRHPDSLPIDNGLFSRLNNFKQKGTFFSPNVYFIFKWPRKILGHLKIMVRLSIQKS